MRTDELDFNLPDSLIATLPAVPRDDSRLLVVSRSDPDRIEDCRFSDLPSLLMPEDLMVFNQSSVIPARFQGLNIETGGAIDGLYLHDAPGSSAERLLWVAYIKARRPRVGRMIGLVDASGSKTDVIAELIEPYPAEGSGAWVLAIHGGPGTLSSVVLEAVGGTPLPPYILSKRKAREQIIDDQTDRASYQTIYADATDSGSIAAPTAGLHFTEDVLKGLGDRSIETSRVVLHVGAGTFQPVDSEHLENHPMHAEWCSMGTAARVFDRGRPDQRVFAVGSTSARTLESFAELHGSGHDLSQPIETRILIAPGYEWKWVDGMVTNFHLPRSTLIAMVASLLDDPSAKCNQSGIERIREIYTHAIHKKYRFYSYGDAMLILP